MGLRWAGDKKLQATGRKLGARALVARSWLPRQERGGSGAAVSSRQEQREDVACSLQNHSLLTSKNISSTELQFSPRFSGTPLRGWLNIFVILALPP